jgi:hypothetical protein
MVVPFERLSEAEGLILISSIYTTVPLRTSPNNSS